MKGSDGIISFRDEWQPKEAAFEIVPQLWP
jgi:hypothetical protein